MLVRYLKEIDRPDFLPFPFEVIVTDNASNDDGYQALDDFKPAHYAFEFRRRPRNIGALPNFLGCLRLARGVLCTYIGDDDRLIPTALAETVRAMQANPAIVATFAVYDEIDLVTGKITMRPERFPEAIVTSADAADMVRQFRDRRLIPEIAVYRTEAMCQARLPNRAIYFAHLQLERLLRLGPIRLSADPFYLFVRGSAEEPYPRRTMGRTLPLSYFDQIIRGATLLQRRFEVPDGAPARPLEGADQDYLVWMLQALDYAVGNGRHIEAAELTLLVRGLFRVHFPDKDLGDIGSFEAPLRDAAFEIIARLAEEIPGIARVVLKDFGDLELSDFLSVILKLDIETPIEFEAYEETGSRDDARLIVTVSEDERREIVAAGNARPGLVVSLEALARMLQC